MQVTDTWDGELLGLFVHEDWEYMRVRSVYVWENM